MSNYRELLENTLDALKDFDYDKRINVINKIEEELEKPDAEPFACFKICYDMDNEPYLSECYDDKDNNCFPVYISPPQQKPLSRKVILQIIEGGESLDEFTLLDFVREIEKAHGIGV